jgi:DNA-binding SARP family transcriptional activator
VEFRILGPLEIVDDAGNPVPLGPPQQRALLAALLLKANEVVPTERLIDELWGEQPPKTATASLQNAVSALRKVLGPEILQTRPPGYVLSVDPEQIDLGRFERLVGAARDRGPEERATTLREALALWRGDPLVDFAFEAFAQGEIRRLEELRLTALEDRIDADLEAGRVSELVGELEALVARHPVRERLRGQLMLALYRVGRQADALNAYQSARRELVQELGIEPGPALQQLHAAILRQQRSLDVEPAPTEEDDLADAAKALLAGRLVPVLGIEASDIAGRLSERFDVPPEEGQELPRVAQWVTMMQGPGPLQDELRSLLAAEAAPTPVHRFLASLPRLLRERDAPHQLIVTTGYDLALEQAFLEAGEEFDVVAYVAGGRNQGKFFHVAPDRTARLIDVPNTYATELSLERRTVILKLHGGVDPDPGRDWESFVVTEDDYIDYIAQGDVGTAVPVALAATLRRSHLLFLGYGMREWNLRAILTRVWGGGAVAYRSWAVMPAPRPVEREFWRSRGVRLVEQPLEAYVDSLARYAGVATETSA